MDLHPRSDRIDDIRKITIRTHESAIRLIKGRCPTGRPRPLHSVHGCRPLIFDGSPPPTTRTTPRRIRARQASRQDGGVEDKRFSADYLNGQALDRERDHRRVQDGSKTRGRRRVPDRHRRRRREGIRCSSRSSDDLARRFPAKQQHAIIDVRRREGLEAMPVHEFVDLMVVIAMSASATFRIATIRLPPRLLRRRRSFAQGRAEVNMTGSAIARLTTMCPMIRCSGDVHRINRHDVGDAQARSRSPATR